MPIAVLQICDYAGAVVPFNIWQLLQRVGSPWERGPKGNMMGEKFKN